ncbi:MAG: YggU family protein [Planctomycetes bacterium]|nr:YggU family protein [Planctomycetota bacterium]
MPTPQITESEDGVIFRVKVVPGSSKTQIAGVFDGMLKVRVSAPPEKGKANKCLTEYLAKILAVKKKDVRVVSGLTSPVKKIAVTELTTEEAGTRLSESLL